ncbi:AMP-binding protein [Ruegeria sp. HKCCC1038]|uniref:AMP-binding protein n=1 Tax=Ruegeria sp. HKCCC1038 TaxID=2682982 RepID=UPI001489D1AC|nr:AMP-binding protein [Ruegeria sp. HKCCC1038]
MTDVKVVPEEIRDTLHQILAEILQASPSETETLVAQGMDSVDAENLLESLQELGFDIEYEFLLGDATFESLLERLTVSDRADPDPVPMATPQEGPVPLTGTQSIWAELEKEGWKDWANISLCLSIPEKLVPATWLPAMVQALADRNEALRMVLLRPEQPNDPPRQIALPEFQIPVEMRAAPVPDQSVTREIEAFEGTLVSPYGPSARALILHSSEGQDRHWICLSMHHVFSDRISMQSLEKQFKQMLLEGRLKADSGGDDSFTTYANARAELESGPKAAANRDKLEHLLDGADIRAERPAPKLSNSLGLSLGDLPTTGVLHGAETHAVEACAQRLETTVPLLLHALSSALITRLTTGAEHSQDRHPLLCHVISNRHQVPQLKNTVGCLDTSVPVAPFLGVRDTLKAYCASTRHAFTEATKLIPDLPRGSWLNAQDGVPKGPALIERVPHINIVRRPRTESPDMAALDVREHTVRRAQKPRWGLLLRAELPPSEKYGASLYSETVQETGLRLSAFSEDRDLAIAAHYCLTQCLRSLIALTPSELEQLSVHELVERVVENARFASQQVAKAAALVADAPTHQPFIYEKLIERQRRWYVHDDKLRLVRDQDNRFVGTAANPFPFTQLDKLKERTYLESLGVPLPNLLHVLPKADLAQSLPSIAPELPCRFVLKPVGAGHSFGVTVVRDGLDLTRNGSPFDVQRVTAELSAMAAQGSCTHEGKVYPFNFSTILIEELVEDACGFDTPTDYKIFMIGSELLWIQLHFKQDGHTWVAFLDENFQLLAEPAWDPRTCWRTHRALVCMDQKIADARRPECLDDILVESRRLADRMRIFVRLDWYADARRGPLMGEITTFPHMLQPRTFYTAWANYRVRRLWQEPDGVAPETAYGDAVVGRTKAVLNGAPDQPLGVSAFLPDPDRSLWAKGDNISFTDLRDYVDKFDLTPWGVAAGARVALVLPNGTTLSGALLAVMNRYVAVPLGADAPAEFLATQLANMEVEAAVVLADTDEAAQLRLVAKQIPHFLVIELGNQPGVALPVPSGKPSEDLSAPAPLRLASEPVLLLLTSGTTGAQKTVTFSLEKLMRAGALIAQSLDLAPHETGLSVLPLHHVGGISCNLVAPLLSGASMRFQTGFDPHRFFEELDDSDGISWVYMVPTLWNQVLAYASEHPELSQNKPWPKLRALRNAGADLPHEMAEDLSALFGDNVHVLPTYGMTEAMPIAAPPPSYRLEKPGTVGPVLPDMEVEIVDTTAGAPDTVLEPGEIGEITVRGPNVIDGYENEDPAPDDPFTGRGFFRTGDLGEFAADGSGWLSVKGRLKEAINRGGKTISPLEIEATLRRFPDWADMNASSSLMVFPRAHSLLGEDVALAVTDDFGDVDLKTLNAWAAKQLPLNMLPQTLVYVQELPMSAAGKPLRMRLSQQLNAVCAPAEAGQLETYELGKDGPVLRESTSAQSVPDPQMAADGPISIENVIDVIQPYLRANVTVTDDTHLGDVGVNSLAALEMVLALNDRFGADLPTWAVSDHPTPRALLAQLNPQAISGQTVLPTLSQHAKRPQSSDGVRRVLFLHGEASDADLAERSLRATFWVDGLRGKIEFVFLDAPHQCSPKPNFHGAAVAAGLYTKPMYRSWGGIDATRLNESLEVVMRALDELGPIHGIAGVCDGALVAALVAARHSELGVFMNFASGPVSESAAQHDWKVETPTLHLISPQDSLHTLGQLMEVPSRCDRAVILQHSYGHALPPLKGELKGEIEEAIDLIFGQVSRDPAADPFARPLCQPSAEISVEAKLPSEFQSEQNVADPETRVHVKEAMEKILGHDDFGPSDDFFEKGGNSLSAMELSLTLEQTLGIKLPLELFALESASVDRLVQSIEHYRANSPQVALVPMNSSNAEPVIYALPTLGGHLSDYLAFSDAIGPYAQLVGIRYGKLLSNAPTERITLDEMAQSAAEVVLNQPHRGPVYLVGFSIAGIFAYETARTLMAAGQPVTLLLIDAEPVVERGLRFKVKQALRRTPVQLLRKPNRNPHLRDVNHDLRSQLVEWKPHPIDLKTVLFCAEDGPIKSAGVSMWTEAVGGQIVLKTMQGGHTGIWSADIAQVVANSLANEFDWTAS